jgi:hypothetical protein
MSDLAYYDQIDAPVKVSSHLSVKLGKMVGKSLHAGILKR